MLLNLRISFCVVCMLTSILCHPTIYRMKDNKVLELDLVPVSSTVIPLPSYQVGYGLNVSHGSNKHFKHIQPQGTKLITEQNKKKYYYGEKKQQSDTKEKSESL